MALGTLGAFIRIRDVVPDRRKLFDIAVAGPIAGFVALLPFLVYGVAHSPPVPIASGPAGFVTLPGHNLTLMAVTRLVHGPLPADTLLNLHPFVLAAWVGLLATALNLFPVGQLDGVHILYAVTGRRSHYRVARIVWWLVALAGLLFPGWLVWALVIRLVLGLRHPPLADEATAIGGGRRLLALVALLLLVLSLMPVPNRDVRVGAPLEAPPAGVAPGARRI
jgi:membrane-associated protease RseP (regulator of RpoE activity)